MNIRLDKDFRIRMEQSDLSILIANGVLRQKYVLENVFSFEIEIYLGGLNSSSHSPLPALEISRQKVTIILAQSDLDSLQKPFNKKLGLQIGDFNLQVDMWEEKKRKTYEAE